MGAKVGQQQALTGEALPADRTGVTQTGLVFDSLRRGIACERIDS